MVYIRSNSTKRASRRSMHGAKQEVKHKALGVQETASRCKEATMALRYMYMCTRHQLTTTTVTSLRRRRRRRQLTRNTNQTLKLQMSTLVYTLSCLMLCPHHVLVATNNESLVSKDPFTVRGNTTTYMRLIHMI